MQKLKTNKQDKVKVGLLLWDPTFLKAWRKEAFASSQNGSELKANFSIKKIFPWFIFGFLAMSIVALVVEIAMGIV